MHQSIDEMEVCGACAVKIAERFRDRFVYESSLPARKLKEADAAERARLRQHKEDHYARLGWTTLSEQPADLSFVYYVAIGDHIKIGYTGNLRERLRALRAPVDDLLAVEYGGRREESARHDQFAHLRITSRWENFRRGDDLLSHIEALREANGIPGWLSIPPRRGVNGPVIVRRVKRDE